MRRYIRRALTLTLVLATVAVTPSAEARGQANVDGYALGAIGSVSGSSSPKACSDKSYSLTGAKWAGALEWSFHASSTPAGMTRKSTKLAMGRGFNNIVNARNDCGRGDMVGATARYLGATTQRANCSAMDGRNVVGFRRLPDGLAAQTCWWFSDGRMLEADIQINSKLRWATSLAGCRNQLMLEAVMTHEVGHAFGVGHVAEATHGRLTMSTQLDGLCTNREATLGLGDLLALETLYQ